MKDSQAKLLFTNTINMRVRIRVRYLIVENLIRAFKAFPLTILLLILLHFVLSRSINYRDPLHVMFVMTMVFPYLGVIFMLLLNPLSPVKTHKKRAPRYLILAEITIILAIGTWIFSIPFRSKALPVGYDTPMYVGTVDLLISGKIPLLKFRRRMGYFIFLYLLARTLNIDPITVGKLLQLQGVFLAISMYLYALTLMDHKTAFLSGIFAIVWNRTHRVTRDLHANTASLSLLYIFLAVLNIKLKKHIKIPLLIILLAAVASLHEMPIVVLLCTLSAFYGYKLMRNKDRKVKIIGVILPSLPFILCTFASYTFSMDWGDLTRKWWPEISIFSNRFLYMNRPEYLCFLALLSIPRLLYVSGGPILLLYTLMSILFSQNFYFGLHALPERFLVLIPLPILASIGYISLLECAFSLFQKMPKLGAAVKKELFVGFFIIIMLITLTPAFERAKLYMSRIRCYITNGEYEELLYLKHYISEKNLNINQVLILFPHRGMEAWSTYLGGRGAIYSAEDNIIDYFKERPELKYIYLIVFYRIPEVSVKLDLVHYRVIYRGNHIRIYEIHLENE